ncbi:pyridoxamine 5'-phosphate oxidase [Antarcticibacterium arcticum]|uniref:Pyridoxamine 5'-phosphate oxidase n=1 Tax=Antarcticibacterium arcticum TaxID=2585771 RepID=A0A5B8YNU4_9FLAO|nr:pyridoxamine 5'-phosphate oxidase family protein [Antarcticibacterium arcticum]QED37499.1 pyridoxamine 5'-phosphate oxidase [Antarcticibacterium arcticum]
MIEDLFKETWRELEQAPSTPDHPFSLCCLATNDLNGGIKQRLVNFRKLTSQQNLLFYTDSRSAKIDQLQKNDGASVLFYNPVLQLQIFIRGRIVIHNQGKLWDDHRVKIEGRSLQDYNTQYAPGKHIKNPLDVKRTQDLNFALLELKPEVVEYLKLRIEPNRLRALFTKKEGEWEKTFLIP